MFKVEAVVIGAGVIGLAVARALARLGIEVVVLEKEDGIGQGISSRNSEVIHAGLYYKPGSLKARLCVEGRRRLYAYCEERGIPHHKCGKLVVATSSTEVEQVEQLKARAEENDVEEVTLISKAELADMEPDLRGEAALLSPTTGIIEGHALMVSFRGDAESVGTVISFRTPVLDAAIVGEKIQLRTGGTEAAELEADLVVNCAGLYAWDVSRKLKDLDMETIPQRHLAKGSYFGLAERVPFRHLIYPVPESGGLGIHLTFDLGGQARFGPDVEWVDHIDYHVDPERSRAFYTAIRRYWPMLPDDALLPGYSGIRPKVTGMGQEASDFIIQGPAQTGHHGYIALYGIESPGLTASLAIADYVAALSFNN